tara:strand:+ start:2042 stop:2155 length:114 start_codon:yes stop_codon:yes gene_type:complete
MFDEIDKILQEAEESEEEFAERVMGDFFEMFGDKGEK